MKTNNPYKKILVFIALTGIFSVLTFVDPNTAYATINKEINYQGKLFTSSGTAVSDANYNIRYKLYTASSGGSPIWTETLCYSPDSGTTCDGTGTDSRTAVASGLFSTLLGSISTLDAVSFNQTLYLGVEIGGTGTTPSWDGEMTPRKKIGAVPAAFEADKLDGLSSEQFLRSDASNSTTTSTTFLTLIQNGVGNIADFIGQSSQTVMSILSNGNVGIGTTSPGQKLSVAGAILGDNIIGSYFTATSTTATSTFAGGVTGPGSFTIQSSSGNVGIGTSSPNAKLEVTASSGKTLSIYNTGTLASDIGLYVLANNVNPFASVFEQKDTQTSSPQYVTVFKHTLSSGTAAAGFGVGFRFDLQDDVGTVKTGGYIRSTVTDPVAATFSTALVFASKLNNTNFERMRIEGNGNVGIGTTSPGQKLSVAGDILGNNIIGSYFTATSTTATSTIAGLLTIGTTTSNQNDILTLYKTGSGSNNNAISTYISNQGQSALQLQSYRDSAVGGYVQFFHYRGTQSSPSVVQSGDRLGYITGTGYSAAALSGIIASGIKLEVDGEPDTSGDTTDMPGRITFFTTPDGSGTVAERMRIDSAGNVGIGTTTPYAKLSVTNTGSNPSFVVEDSTSPDSSPFIIDASGNVGIGTTAPLDELHVVGDIRISGDIRNALTGTAVYGERVTDIENQNTYLKSNVGLVADSNGGSFILLQSGTTAGGSVNDGTATIVAYGLGTGVDSNAIKFSTRSGVDAITERMRINTSGNIGIGTTTPYAKLSVVGQAVAEYFTATSTTVASVFPYASTTALSAGTLCLTGDVCRTAWPTGGLGWASSTSPDSNSIYSTALSNVGIGTTTPNWKLSVAGTRPSISLSDTSAGTDNKHWLFSSMGGNLYISTSTDSLSTTSIPAVSLANNGVVSVNGRLTIQSTSRNGDGGMYLGTLQYLNTVNNNLFFGRRNGNNTTTGIGANVAIGDDTMQSITTGQDNLSMGSFSQTSVTTGNYNSSVGFAALQNNQYSSYNVGIGDYACSYVGYDYLGSNYVGNENTCIGHQSGNVHRGQENVFIGANAGADLPNALGDGSQNSAIGNYAMYSNNSGASSTVSGYKALYSNTSGSFNTANGTLSLFSSTDTSSSTAMGAKSLFTSNSKENTALGAGALYGVTTGVGQNIGIGAYAGSNITTGSGNIIIGNYIAMPSATQVSGLNIGNLLYGTTLSGTASRLSTGNIGIGTTTPGQKLSVAGDVLGNNIIGSYFTATSSTASTFPYASTTALTVSSAAFFPGSGIWNASGNVGIGTALPATQAAVGLHIDGVTSEIHLTSSAGGSSVTDGTQIQQWTDNNFYITNREAGAIILKTNSSEALRISSTGYVGIGTSTPNTKLNVYSGSAGGVVPVLTSGISIEDDQDTGLYILTPDNKHGLINFGNNSDSNAVQFDWDPTNDLFSIGNVNSGADMRFLTGNYVEAVRILDNGNLGIGTTTPYATLSVTNTGTNPSFVVEDSTSPDSSPFIIDASGNVAIQRVTAEYPLTFGTTGLSLSFSGGRYGLAYGTDGTLTHTAVVANGAASTAAVSLGFMSSGTTMSTSDYVPALIVRNTGNVGIGTTSPYAKLSVVGQAVAEYFTATSSTASTFPYASTTALTVSGAAFFPGSGIWNASGNVGIGTVAPGAKLEINNTGLGLATPAFVIDGDDASSDSALINLSRGSNGRISGNIYSLNEVTEWFTGTYYNAGSSQTNFGIGSSYDVANQKLIITSTGNVGIGTTSPYRQLSVGNNAVFGGDVLASYFTATSSTASTFPYASTTALSVSSAAYFPGSGIWNSNGFVGIGTTSPYAALSVVGATGVVADIYTATSTTATSTFAGGINAGSGNFIYDFTTGVTSVTALQTGNFNFDTDAGLVSWADLPLSSATDGTPQGYTAYLNGSSTISVYGVSSGSGWLRNDYPRIAIGSTSAPTSKLTVYANGTGTGGTFELVNNASTTLMKVLDNGNVGIGSTTPWASFAINPMAGNASNQFVIGSSTATNFIVNNTGYVGIATTSPWRNLSVVGTVALNGLTSSATGNAVCITTDKEITDAGGASCTPSSIRFKENVKNMSGDYAINKLSKLNVVDFDYKEKQPFETNHSYGMIAEDVEKIDKNLVDYGYDGKPLSLHFEKITGLLVKAVQEQQGQIGSIGSTTSRLDLSNNELALSSNLAMTNVNSRIDLLDSQIANLNSSSTLIISLASSTASIVASTTAEILANSESFLERIFNSFKEYLTTAIINVKSIFVKELHVEEKLCIDDVCVNKDQLKALIVQSNVAGTSTPVVKETIVNNQVVPQTQITTLTSEPVASSTTTADTTVSTTSTQVISTQITPPPTSTPDSPKTESTTTTDKTPVTEATATPDPAIVPVTTVTDTTSKETSPAPKPSEPAPVSEPTTPTVTEAVEPAPTTVSTTETTSAPAPVAESAPTTVESSTQP